MKSGKANAELVVSAESGIDALSQRENFGNLSRVGVGKSKQIFLQTGLCNRKKKCIRCLETILLILSRTRLQRKDNNTTIEKAMKQ